jgi:hypothetical protein
MERLEMKASWATRGDGEERGIGVDPQAENGHVVHSTHTRPTANNQKKGGRERYCSEKNSGAGPRAE